MCNECGLPHEICTALADYLSAYEAYDKGDIATARDCSNKAQALVASYKQARFKLRQFTLSDEDRFALSRLKSCQ
jgi:hypothetical protein